MSCACPCRGTARSGSRGLQRERLGRLRGVRVLGARVDLELRDLRAREPVAGEHALDRLAEHLRRLPVELLAQRPAAKPARVARVTVVPLLIELLAGDG